MMSCVSNYLGKVYFNFNTISYEKKISLTDVDLDLQIYINNGDSYWPCAMSNDELKDKMNVYIFKYGTCKIDKVYPYPYSNGFKCKILTGNEKSENISLDTPIYYLPYKRQPKPQINIFNESFNEDLLMPIKVCYSNQNLINLYWKEVENASDYIIEIYKIFILKDGIRSIYHLESVEINKNQKYYSSTNFVRDNIVFVVKAEDKNGNIMAQSRGILNEKPKNWD